MGALSPDVTTPNRSGHPLRVNAARQALLEEFASIIATHPGLDRAMVSFQGNRRRPRFAWFKFREGFSAELVEYLVRQSGRSPGVLLDPFAGSGAALFVGRDLGWRCVGIEMLPVACFAVQARLVAERIDPRLLRRRLQAARSVRWADHFSPEFALRHAAITAGAFPPQTERALAGYRAWCRRHIRDPHVRNLFEFAAFAVLEDISYTRKDGQYLRWDHRAGKTRITGRFEKGVIPDFRRAVLAKLDSMLEDLTGDQDPPTLFDAMPESAARAGDIQMRQGSCLEVLPDLTADSVDLIITSPPYCNRYDYTRTYALELVFLGLGTDEIKSLRQAMLSCTVENRAKLAQLAEAYERRRQRPTFDRVLRVFEEQAALQEVLDRLVCLGREGRLNNANIPRLVRNYFLEMCFLIYELSRVLGPGGTVFMVNDNVRYGGEEVPVDLILSDLARSFGLAVERIWTLPRGKGNSSQQMSAYGRSELRKCVYQWRKPAPGAGSIARGRQGK